VSDLVSTVAGSGARERRKVRQAVVIVHGMGEQRPLDALTQFVKAALPPDDRPPSQRKPTQPFYSRPDLMTESYESRVFLAPRVKASDESIERTQTEFYEYHWAHLMQGNRLDDMWPTFKRMMLRAPTRVPAGLRVVWGLFWALLVFTAIRLWQTDWGFAASGWSVKSIVEAVLGAGMVGFVLTYIITRVLPTSTTKSFVDVVRYLDTSPRSYGVRRDIRKGMVDLLVNLHNTGNYQRIVIVAHSLGAFIAYDGISYLWAHVNKLHGKCGEGDAAPDGLLELEKMGSELPDEAWSNRRGKAPPTFSSRSEVDRYQTAQRRLWLGLRSQGNPWLITDFITLGAPMYFADRLFTKNLSEFKRKVLRWELPTCPPQAEGDPDNNTHETKRWFSWNNFGRRVLYHGAPFAVVRWTNMWFPARWGFFGDWFGHRLAPLFGNGIMDIPLKANRWRWPIRSRFIPGYAHALYLQFPENTSSGSVTTLLRDAIDYRASRWLEPTLEAPQYDKDTA
jgi:hypothetical protein